MSWLLNELFWEFKGLQMCAINSITMITVHVHVYYHDYSW